MSSPATQPQPAPQGSPAADSSVLQAVIKATEGRSPEVQTFELHQRQARLFAMSGLFSDIKGTTVEEAIARAFVKIDLGESMGLSAAEAMTGIDLIQGRVAISANIRAARMQRAGYDWDILQLDEKGCRLQLKFKGQILMREDENGKRVPAVISFLESDATKAGLIGKDMFKKYPPNMYFARAITNAQRWYAPGILSINILSSEEAAEIQESPAPDYAAAERIEELFKTLEYTNRQSTQALAKYAGRPEELIEWLEKQLAKKQNDGSQPKQDAEKSPAKEADTKSAATAEKSTPTATSTTSEPVLEGESRQEFENDRMGQTGEDNAKKMAAKKPSPAPAVKASTPPPELGEW